MCGLDNRGKEYKVIRVYSECMSTARNSESGVRYHSSVRMSLLYHATEESLFYAIGGEV